MKLLLLADPNSVHTIKWATSLAKRDVETAIFGLGALTVSSYNNIENLRIITAGHEISNSEGAPAKIKYIRAVPQLCSLIKEFKPDILHAHFATSYGLLGALSGFSPLVLSVWGSDVFSFPEKSPFHKALLKFNLKRADRILSTSEIMASVTKKYTEKSVTVTPFGIDLERFCRTGKRDSINDIIIGTTKSLDPRYGIDDLIRAFNIVCSKYPEKPLKLMIVGGGPLEDNLKSLSKELKISEKVFFTGRVPFESIPEYHNKMDIEVFLSNQESFGVAVLEASACENPVVVSDVGGLPEVVEENVTGIIVPPKNLEAAAEAIEKLVIDRTLREKMGKAGRKRTEQFYGWNSNVESMLGIYNEILGQKRSRS